MMKYLHKRINKLFFCCLTMSLLYSYPLKFNQAFADTIVIGNSNVPAVSAELVQKIFTGRSVVVDGVSLTPVNAKQGSDERNKFLQTFLNQDEEKYQAYWIVRQFVGKGRQPRSFDTSKEIIDFCKNNKGGIGYINSTESGNLPSGVKILLKK